MKRTIPARLRYLKDEYPNFAAFIFFTTTSRQVITFERLYCLAGRFAQRLVHQGFERGDVIANTLANSPERLITDLGILLAGCITLNGAVVLASGKDFFQNAQVACCRGVVAAPSDDNPAWLMLRRTLLDDQSGKLFAEMSCPDAENLATAILVHREGSDLGVDLIRTLETRDEEFEAEVQPGDTAVVFTTSGSTGYSKLVPRSHSYFFELTPSDHAEQININLTHEIAHYNDRPLGWLGGFPVQTLTVGTRRLLLDQFDGAHNPADKAALTWKILREEKVQVPYVLPMDFYALLDHVGELAPDDRVALLGTGSQPMMRTLIRDMMKVSKSVLLSYGSTELGIVSYKIVTDLDQFDDFSAGKPVVERVRIVDKDLRDCPVGSLGTIWVLSRSLFAGYYTPGNPNKSRPPTLLNDGWFNTEDMGYMNETGVSAVAGESDKDALRCRGCGVGTCC